MEYIQPAVGFFVLLLLGAIFSENIKAIKLKYIVIAVLIQSYQDQQLDNQKRGDILKNIHTKWVLLEEKWRRIKEENTRLRKRGKKHDGS